MIYVIDTKKLATLIQEHYKEIDNYKMNREEYVAILKKCQIKNEGSE